jgi:hypothetical protein
MREGSKTASIRPAKKQKVEQNMVFNTHHQASQCGRRGVHNESWHQRDSQHNPNLYSGGYAVLHNPRRDWSRGQPRRRGAARHFYN